MSTQTDIVSPLTAARYAFFFDVDGTLAQIQPSPDEVTIPTAVLDSLQQLSARCDGALALVSGRPLHQLDALVAPLKLPLAGVHGAERRDAAGEVSHISLSAHTAGDLTDELEQALAALPGTLLENKGMAFALHYRQAPQHQQAIEQLAATLVARYPELVQQPGKCVVELKPAGVNKGAAITDFMQTPPFSGRIPLFIGDDLTDEAGFRAVNAMAGISVKVGDGPSDAQHYLSDVAAVHRWLEQTLLQLD